MKTIRSLSMLAVLAASVTILHAQAGATTSPTPPPAAAVQTTPAPSVPQKKSLPEPDKLKAEAELDTLHGTYSTKGNWYLAMHFVFAIGAALAGAIGGFLLQMDTPERSFKRVATILAFVGSALVIVTTYVDFRTNSIANKVAANQVVRLKIQVERGDIPDQATLLDKEQEIYEGKQITEKVIEVPKKQ